MLVRMIVNADYRSHRIDVWAIAADGRGLHHADHFASGRRRAMATPEQHSGRRAENRRGSGRPREWMTWQAEA